MSDDRYVFPDAPRRPPLIEKAPSDQRRADSQGRLQPPCWDDGSCATPVECSLHGCRRTGYLGLLSEAEATNAQRRRFARLLTETDETP